MLEPKEIPHELDGFKTEMLLGVREVLFISVVGIYEKAVYGCKPAAPCVPRP